MKAIVAVVLAVLLWVAVGVVIYLAYLYPEFILPGIVGLLVTGAIGMTASSIYESL